MPWWAAALVTAVLVLVLQSVLLMAAGVQASAHGVAFEESLRVVTLDPLNLALAQALACALAVWLGLRWRREGRVRTRLWIEPAPHAVVALGLVAGLAAQFPLTEIENLLREVWPMPVEEQLRIRRMLTPDGAWDGFAIVLALVLVAPVGEELVFRGTLLPGMERRHGTRPALVLSGLLFGAAHLEPGVAITAAVAGLLLGAVAIRTGSVLPAIAMHAGINATPILLPERVVPIPGLNTVSREVYHLSAPLLLSSTTVAAVALVAMVWLTDRDIR